VSDSDIFASASLPCVRSLAVRLPVITDMWLALVLCRGLAGLTLVTVGCHAGNSVPKFIWLA
jgi:hypothetical protein